MKYKGYIVPAGYMGWIPDENGSGSYVLFATESDYLECVNETFELTSK